jgi:hypothetical protein
VDGVDSQHPGLAVGGGMCQLAPTYRVQLL